MFYASLANVPVQRLRPGTRSGGNCRVEILQNRPTAQRGGGSLERAGWAASFSSLYNLVCTVQIIRRVTPHLAAWKNIRLL